MRPTLLTSRKTQDMLIQSEKMALAGQLSVGVAHEIKNPLAIIFQANEAIKNTLLKSKFKEKEKIAKYSEMIKQASLRANKVISELLNFSRPAQSELKHVFLKDIITRALYLIQNKAKICAAKICIHYPQEDLLINADMVLMEEVFLNLMNNSLEAHCRNIKITISSSSDRKYAVIHIEDDGSGIEKDYLNNIFDPFFSTKKEGTGLGLAMVYHILKRHNATIQAKSLKGKWTKFAIHIPRLKGERCVYNKQRR
jgi:two-component system sensor histidine kinase HydH